MLKMNEQKGQYPQRYQSFGNQSINDSDNISRNHMVTTGYSSNEVTDTKGSVQMNKMRLSSREQQPTLDSETNSQMRQPHITGNNHAQY